MRTTLRVHHIDERPANNVPENLIVLCKGCHSTHHNSVRLPGNTSPWPWFAEYAAQASLSMTSKWRHDVACLQAEFSSIAA